MQPPCHRKVRRTGTTVEDDSRMSTMTVSEILSQIERLPSDERLSLEQLLAKINSRDEPSTDAKSAHSATAWQQVNAFRERLAKSDRTFSDSAELLREDRDR